MGKLMDEMGSSLVLPCSKVDTWEEKGKKWWRTVEKEKE
jgi:hypothetical protein